MLETEPKGTGDPRVAVISVPDGRRRVVYAGLASPAGWSGDVSPDGKSVVYTANEFVSDVWLVEGFDAERR